MHQYWLNNMFLQVFIPLLLFFTTEYHPQFCVADSGGSSRTDIVTELLNPPCWHNWTHAERWFDNKNFTPTIWSWKFRDWEQGGVEVTVDLQNVSNLAQTYPNRIWLLWNEPDLFGQAATPAIQAIPHTIQWMDAIGNNGIKACCGTVHLGNSCATLKKTTGIKWLNDYVNNNGPIPDVWHIHIYCATSTQDWQSILDEFWQWWTIHGKNKPLLITETSGGINSQLNRDLILYISQLQDERILEVYWFATINTGSSTWNSQLINHLTETRTILGNLYMRYSQGWSTE